MANPRKTYNLPRVELKNIFSVDNESSLFLFLE